MKKILALLIITILAISQMPAFAANELFYTQICDIRLDKCKRIATQLNDYILKNPHKEMPDIIFTHTNSWYDILPEKTLRIYALFHPSFYWGQLLPVGQERYYCWCEIETALEIQEKLRVQLIIPPEAVGLS